MPPSPRRAVATLALLAACGAATPAPVMPIVAPITAPVVAPITAPVVPAVVAPVVAPPPATKVRTIEGITEYRLANGLQVLLFPDPTEATITVNVTYLVGSRHEGYGESGMAHLLEHMMFKGSPRFRNVLSLLEARGGQANGSTSTDRTNYYETLPATADNLGWTLELEADRMRHAAISPEDLATEFSVVRNEFEMGESEPLAILEERLVATAFLWHGYGKATIGSRADIERVPVPALRAFYDRYYQPDDAVLIVAGKFDDAEALATIGRTFGAIPAPTRTLAPTYTVEPVQDGERTVTLRRTGDVHAVGVAYHTVGAASPDYPAVLAALDLLTREPTGLLYRQLVEPKLAAAISGGQDAFRDPYLAIFLAEVRDGAQLAKVEQAIVTAAEGLASHPIDARGLARWRTAELKELELAFTDSSRLAVELSEYAALGDWRTLFAHRARIEAITAADVQRVAAAYFRPSNRTTGRFVPTAAPARAPLTTTPDLAAAVAGIDGAADGRAATATGEAFPASLDAIAARTTQVELAGGLRAALLPKQTRGGKVVLTLRLHVGDATSLQGQATVASVMGELLGRGTKAHRFDELADREDELRAHLAIHAQADGVEIELQTLRAHLPGAIDLLAELLTTPTFPAKELEVVRQARLAALEQQRQDPATIAAVTLATLTTRWPAADPRAALDVAAQLAAVRAVTVAQVRAFHRELVGAGHGEVAIVGDFDPVAVRAQLERAFGGWQARRPYARLVERTFDVPATTRTLVIRDKEMAALAFGYDVAMRDDDPDYPAWLIVGQLLGGDASSRLWMRVREHDGLSYGVDAATFAGALDPVGGLGGSAIVAPANLARAKAAIVAELTALAAGPITEAELDRAKHAWLQQRDTNLASDGYVAGLLADHLFEGRSLAWTRALGDRIAALTVADVQRVAARYLTPARLVIVEAGDLPPTKP
jgi:zinc protease